MLCLRCGKNEQYSDNLCESCLLETSQVLTLPEVLQANVCPSCNKILSGRSWLDCKGGFEEAALFVARSGVKTSPDLLHTEIELNIDRQDHRLFSISGTYSGSFKGLIAKGQLRTEVRISLFQCPFCSRQHGSYYEAILQVRGVDHLSDEEREDLISQVRARVVEQGTRDSNVFITKEELVKGGFDFYLGEKTFARQTAAWLQDRYGGEIKTSATLAGRKEGKEQYRVTYLVRLPPFTVGDYFLQKDGPYRMDKVKEKKVAARSLTTGNILNLDIKDAMLLKIFRAQEVESDLVVIMEAEREVQVMHPESYKTLDLVKPPGYTRPEGQTVRCALIEGDLYLV